MKILRMAVAALLLGLPASGPAVGAMPASWGCYAWCTYALEGCLDENSDLYCSGAYWGCFNGCMMASAGGGE